MTNSKHNPHVDQKDIAEAQRLEEFAEAQRRAARAMKSACEAWSEVTGGPVNASVDFNAGTVVIRSRQPAEKANGKKSS